MFDDHPLSLSPSVQALQVQVDASATGRLGARTAARSCAAAVVTTRHASAAPPSVSASSTGAAPCTAATVTKRWTFTRVRAHHDFTNQTKPSLPSPYIPPPPTVSVLNASAPLPHPPSFSPS